MNYTGKPLKLKKVGGPFLKGAHLYVLNTITMGRTVRYKC